MQEVAKNNEKFFDFSGLSEGHKNPTVSVITKTYEKGVKVAKKVMKKIHDGFQRTKNIEKYSVLITPKLDTG